jgi:hypothetical protein
MAAETLAGAMPCCCGSIFFLLFGGTLTYAGVQQYLLSQKIKNTPTSKVRSAAAGLVELFGKAKCKDDISSPISKAKCIYWHVNCEYYYHHKKSSGWRTFYSRSSSTPFYLEDDTGKMLVEPKDGQIQIPSDFRSQGHLSDKALFGLLPQKQLDAKVMAWMDADPAVKSAFGGYGGHDLRVTESFIAEGDPLFVLGSAEPIPGAASDVKHENLMVKKNNIDKILFISDSEEGKFVNTMGWVSWIYLFIGLAFLIGALISLLGVMGTFVM